MSENQKTTDLLKDVVETETESEKALEVVPKPFLDEFNFIGGMDVLTLETPHPVVEVFLWDSKSNCRCLTVKESKELENSGGFLHTFNTEPVGTATNILKQRTLQIENNNGLNREFKLNTEQFEQLVSFFRYKKETKPVK